MAQVAMGHHLDLARDSVWLDQLARDIVATAAGDSQLRFKLNPEHLGSLHVELLRHDDGAAVRMTTESEAARAVLADAQGRLVAEARAHGMRITETSVDLNRGGNGGGDGDQRGWGDAQSGQSGQPNPQPRQRNVNASVTMSAVNGDRIEARPARRDLYA
jgi:flagellar hook-length control protein FliK